MARRKRTAPDLDAQRGAVERRAEEEPEAKKNAGSGALAAAAVRLRDEAGRQVATPPLRPTAALERAVERWRNAAYSPEGQTRQQAKFAALREVRQALRSLGSTVEQALRAEAARTPAAAYAVALLYDVLPDEWAQHLTIPPLAEYNDPPEYRALDPWLVSYLWRVVREALSPPPPPPSQAPAGIELDDVGRAGGVNAKLHSPPRHGPGFRSVHWYGADYGFTLTQGACVGVLWEAWVNGTPDVGQGSILEDPSVDADSSRLCDVFRDRKGPGGYHPAWGKMIVPGATKGAFRLNQPTDS